MNKVMEAFNKTPLYNVKVVIIGQEPYQNREQANGLAFSVNKGFSIPYSLKNIFIELEKEFGHPCLAKQKKKEIFHVGLPKEYYF